MITLFLVGVVVDYLTVSAAGRATQKVAILMILGSAILSDIVQLAIIIALVFLGVSWGLKPLRQLRDEIAIRSQSELTLLDEGSAPPEIRPAVQELNRLITTIGETIRSKEELLVNAAHQLRTPLTGMQVQLELMMKDSRAVEVRGDLKTIYQATQRLAHTAHQFLALARAEPGSYPSSSLACVNLRELLEEAIDNQLDRALSRHIDLGAELDEVELIGTSWLLRELVSNLLDNAIKYVQVGGRVTVRCGLRNDFRYIEVEDDGPGIPEHERSQVVERFYRAPGAPGDGCGLGLAIANEVARSHGGELFIRTGWKGQGACVGVLFQRPHISLPPIAHSNPHESMNSESPIV